MKKTIIGIIFLLLLVSNVSAKGLNPRDFQFYNKDIGIAIKFPEGWKIFTDGKNAPDSFKALLENRKSKNDSPLFLGMKKTKMDFQD